MNQQIIEKIKNDIRGFRSPQKAIEDISISAKIIGVGAGRLVIEVDKTTVAKISTNSMGDHQNITEHNVWKTAPKEAKRYLAEVIHISPDNSWLLMEKVDNPTDTYEAFATDAEKEIKQRLAPYGIILNEVEIGYISGSLVACDYGNCEITEE